MTSCRNKYTETPRRTRSFIRKATLSVIAGKPPADAAQPSGMKGMIVEVEIMEKHSKINYSRQAGHQPSFAASRGPPSVVPHQN